MRVLRPLLDRFRVQWANRERHVRVGWLSTCENVAFGERTTIYHLVRLKNVMLGDMTYVANGARIVNARFGKYCSIGPDCRIGLGMHPTSGFATTHPAFYSTQRESQITFVDRNLYGGNELVTVGSDVWIGQSAIVRDGVRIADGAIVGAGAVVTRDVPAYAIVAGVPARVLRYRFDEHRIARLLEFAWWNRDVDWIARHAHLFSDVDALLAA